MRMPDRAVRWIGTSLEDLRSFPAEARRRAGYQLRRLQAGLQPSDWKSLASVGWGVAEIRIHVGTEHRIIYVARFPEAIYVLHAFDKRTRKTARRELDLARRRLAEVNQSRNMVKESYVARRRRSSQNIFRDIGFEAGEARHLMIRSDLMIALSRIIETEGLTQGKAAELFGVSQPRVSDLTRGRIERFSIDALVSMLDRVGAQVRVTVARGPRAA
jgi:phage-related protein/predicted XRE-type DNA-binding protein